MFSDSASPPHDYSVTRTLLEALRLQHQYELYDLFCGLCLSECVYKSVEAGPDVALAALNTYIDQFPPGTVPLQSAQFCRKRVHHRYMVASSSDALYIVFMGTKELRDVFADAAVGKRVLKWLEQGSAQREGPALNDNNNTPSAHGGFLNRADGVPIESLYQHARHMGHRLVLCGHSLGGAVAQLSSLRLLSALPTSPPVADVRCVCFGTPPFGDPLLRHYIEGKGWSDRFKNYALPEDPIPRLLLGARHVTPPIVSSSSSSSSSSLSSSLSEAVEANGDTGASSAASSAPVVLVNALLEADEAAEASKETMTVTNTESKWKGASQSSWTAPGLLLQAMARTTAGAIRNPTAYVPAVPDMIPSFSHVVDITYLEGVTQDLEVAREEEESGPTSAPLPLPLINLPPPAPRFGWMAKHRMPAYRTRVLEIIHSVLMQGNIEYSANRGTRPSQSTDSTTQKTKSSISPSVVLPNPNPLEAEGTLPVLSSKVTSSAFYDLRSQLDATATANYGCEEEGAHTWNPAPGSRRRTSSRLEAHPSPFTHHKTSKISNIFRSSPASSSLSSSSLLPPTFIFEVRVMRGRYLDLCTAAVLHFQGDAGTAVEGEIVDNASRRKVLEQASSDISSESSQTAPASSANSTPELLVQFRVPTATLLQLHPRRVRGPKGSGSPPLPPPLLVLYSDFGKGTVAIDLRSRTAWLLAADGSLGREVFQQFEQSAAAHAAMAAAGARSGATFYGLPLLRKKRKKYKVSPALHQANADHIRAEKNNRTLRNAARAPWLRFIRPVQSALSTLWQQVAPSKQTSDSSTRSSSSFVVPTPHRAHSCPEVLFRGISILDASFALEGLESSVEKLRLAANLLRWKAAQGTSNALTSKESSDPFWDDSGVFKTTQGGGLDLAGRVRRGLRQAKLSLRRRAVLLGRWHVFKTLYSPEIVIIVLGSSSLRSPTDDMVTTLEENVQPVRTSLPDSFHPNLEVLNCINDVVRAAERCRSTVLLALATPEAQDAVFRRRVSFSSGLHGRPGAVVPLQLVGALSYPGQTEEESAHLGDAYGEGRQSIGTDLLQAALLAHGLMVEKQQQQPRGSQEEDPRASTLRARL